MIRSLVRPQGVIASRLLRLEQKLNEELGFRDQRLRFTKRSMRAGPTAWVLRNEKVNASGTVLPQGVVAELAPARNDESILYFGYNEDWQPSRARDQIEFVSSNLRFVIAGVEDMPDLRFRLEWAGAKTDGSTIAYPGSGAAHPHWHLDVDSGWFGPTAVRVAEEEVTIDVNLEPDAGVQQVELAEKYATVTKATISAPRVSATLAGFHHLHLPARTMWHDVICIMPDVATPQQHTPEHEDQIDRWVISALRYMTSEFRSYL